jgi:hypothetical protein
MSGRWKQQGARRLGISICGVVMLTSMHRVRVFEIYADEAAYQAHIRTPHFAKYKAAVQDIVKSLNLLETAPIALGSRSRVNAGANAP